jgi:hypothetical protein
MWLLYAAVILLNMAIAIISESFVKVKTRCALHVFVFVVGGVGVALRCDRVLCEFVGITRSFLLFCRF